MAFNNIKIVGNGSALTAITNTVKTESVINSLVAYNIADEELTFSLIIDEQEVVIEKVPANSSFRFVDKLNVPVNTILSVEAPVGVNVTVSYFQQTIDTAAALTVVQQAAQDASDNADRAENALPAGTIDDESVASNKVFSSSKILAEMDMKADKSTAYTKAEIDDMKANKTDLDLTVSATTTLDLSIDDVLKYTASTNFTLAFLNVPTVGVWTTEITGAGDYIVTYPTISWDNDEVPELSTNTTILQFYTSDGTKIIGKVLFKEVL